PPRRVSGLSDPACPDMSVSVRVRPNWLPNRSRRFLFASYVEVIPSFAPTRLQSLVPSPPVGRDPKAPYPGSPAVCIDRRRSRNAILHPLFGGRDVCAVGLF